MRALNDAVVNYRWPIIIGFILITAGFASRLPLIEVDPEVKNQLPTDMPARINLDRIEDLFGGTDMVMVVLSADDVLAEDSLRRVRSLSRKIERVKHIDRVLSLFTMKEIRADGETMVVDPAVMKIPSTDVQRELLRTQLRGNDQVYGNVIAKDFSATAIIGLLNAEAEDNVVMPGIEAALEAVPGTEQVLLGGLPYIRTQLEKDIGGDMRKLMPLSLLIMLIFLFIAFRQLRGVALPFMVVIMSVIFAFGLLPIIGWKVQMLTVLLPLVLVAVANDYGIHLYARYQEENTPDSSASKQDLARSIVAHLARPVLVTGITTVGGMLCLLSHIIVPAQQVGILAAAGIAFALVASLLFIPAVLSLLPKAKPVAQAAGQGQKLPPLERLLRLNARLVSERPRTVVAGAAVILAVASFGIFSIKVDSNPSGYYPDEHPVARSSDLVNDKFGGSTAISVVASGDVKDPEILAEIDALGSMLEADPRIGQVSSVADMVKTMNLAMHADDPAEERLPDSRNAVAQYFLMYSMSGDPEDFERLVDFPFENALLTARINTTSSTEIAAVVDVVDTYIAEHPDAHFTLAGGFAALFAELMDAIVRGQVLSLLLALLVVSALVSVLFRSVVAGLISTVPLLMSVGIVFGLMGYLGFDLNAPVAMLSSIMIGVGVDYTIHFLWRYRDERRAGRDAVDAARQSLVTTGRGIVFNAMSVVIGFIAVGTSAFVPVKMFGFLIVVSIFTCLVGAMVLLPAIIVIVRPRFLEPTAQS